MNSTSNFDWILSLLAVIVSLIGGIIARDRQVAHAINKGDSKLHEKVDKVRDEYLRKDDFNTHSQGIISAMDRINESQNEMNNRMMDGQTEINRRIDTLLTHFANGKP